MKDNHYVICHHCLNYFWASRSDAKFCSPAHAAAYAREHGEYRTKFHEEKANTDVKYCADCGAAFEYNPYAHRGGKRVPQYCSNKCRQSAYRKRKGANAGYAGNWNDARNDKRTREEKDKDTQQKAKQQKKDTSQKQQKKDTSQSAGTAGARPGAWWYDKNSFNVIGVDASHTFRQAKAKYMKLVKMYHPDVSDDPSANEIMKYVNAAWDRIKGFKWKV